MESQAVVFDAGLARRLVAGAAVLLCLGAGGLTAEQEVRAFVLPGSLTDGSTDGTADGTTAIRFRTINCGQVLEVRYQGILPDTFRDGAEVTLRGVLDGGVFSAHTVWAKCQGKYSAYRLLSPQERSMCTHLDSYRGSN